MVETTFATNQNRLISYRHYLRRPPSEGTFHFIVSRKINVMNLKELRFLLSVYRQEQIPFIYSQMSIPQEKTSGQYH